MDDLWEHMRKDSPEGHNAGDWPRTYFVQTHGRLSEVHQRDHAEHPDVFQHEHEKDDT